MNLKRESIPYTTREAWLAERAKDITSTDVAALFGVSPYLTRWELWHRKVAGDVETEPLDAERVKWGLLLQEAIAKGAIEERGWTNVIPYTAYTCLEELCIGASFDYGSWPNCDYPDAPTFLLECKNVDSLAFRDGWVETEYGLEAPAHIELQAQHQMLVSGIHMTYIAALVGGNRLVILERPYDEEVGERILAECAAFWRDPEPQPDFHRDAALIKRLHAYSAAGTVMDADDDVAMLMAEYKDFQRMESVAKDEKDARHAKILTRIGDSSKVLSEKYVLSCPMLDPVPVKAHTRAGRRGFYVNERKAP